MGFEPTTYHLRGGCSAPELLRRLGESIKGVLPGVLPPPRSVGRTHPGNDEGATLPNATDNYHDAHHESDNPGRDARSREPCDGRHRPLRDGGAGCGVGVFVRRALRRRAAHRAGGHPPEPGLDPVRGGRGHARRSGRGRPYSLRHRGRGRARPRTCRHPRRSGDGHRGGGRARGHRRPGRRQRRDGGPQGVPAGQRSQPDQPQRHLYGHHRQHGRCQRQEPGSGGEWLPHRDPRQPRGPGALAAAAHSARRPHRGGLRQARPEGDLRPPRRGGGRRARSPGEAPPRGAGGTRAHVLEVGAGAVHPTRPAATRVHRRAGHAPGPRDAAVRGTGRPGDGAGARRSLGGRLRVDRTPAVGGGNHRRGPPRHPRGGRARGR